MYKKIPPRRRFTAEEDEHLRHIVRDLKLKNWDQVAKFMPGRTARQCRDRYNSSLYMEAIPRPWTDEEDLLIYMQFNQIGPKWMQISNLLEGRTGMNVKNRWYKHINKNLDRYANLEEKMGNFPSFEPQTPPEVAKEEAETNMNIVVGETNIPNEWNFIWDGQYEQEFMSFMAFY